MKSPKITNEPKQRRNGVPPWLFLPIVTGGYYFLLTNTQHSKTTTTTRIGSCEAFVVTPKNINLQGGGVIHHRQLQPLSYTSFPINDHSRTRTSLFFGATTPPSTSSHAWLASSTSSTFGQYPTRQARAAVSIPSSLQRYSSCVCRMAPPSNDQTSSTSRSTSSRRGSTPTRINLDSKDPWEILGLDPNKQEGLDKKEIKRAYKRLALQYHPDMTTTKDSTPQEKRRASDIFAKINWAYGTLMGKGSASDTTSTSNGHTASSSSSTKSSSSDSSWTPPHRRKAASSSTTSSSSGGTSSTKYDDLFNFDNTNTPNEYDTGGDSLTKIFSDMFTGVASGGVGIFNDFVEFLENNIDGYAPTSTWSSTSTTSSSKDQDPELLMLLQMGFVGEIGEEMDDTELVVQQLTTKLNNLQEELIMITAELATMTRFTERLQLQERVDEMKVREQVIQQYIQRARKRLLLLQTKYKELIVKGGNDPKAGGGRNRKDFTSFSTSASQDPDRSGSRDVSSSFTSSDNVRDEKKEEDAWKYESFGSSGRGRGSSRRSSRTESRSGPSSTQASSEQKSSISSSVGSTTDAQTDQRNSRTQTDPRNPQAQQTEAYVRPPYRSASSTTSFTSRLEEDKRRLREIKVDEEFDQLKRELGL